MEPWSNYNRGFVYTTIMELGSQNHNGDGLPGPNSTMVVDPLSIKASVEGIFSLLSQISLKPQHNPLNWKVRVRVEGSRVQAFQGLGLY